MIFCSWVPYVLNMYETKVIIDYFHQQNLQKKNELFSKLNAYKYVDCISQKY